MIPQEIINDILHKADIVDIISRYLSVKKKGTNFVAVCPFHDDHDPSMVISPTKQIYKCFVCGNAGNVFNFVSNFEKISYFDAIKKVGRLINYSSPFLIEEVRQVDSKTKSVIKALKDASEFYNYVLNTNAGSVGREYLLSRDISEEMISYFKLGYSPNNGKITIDQLRNKDNSVESLNDAGILVRNDEGLFDRFCSRVMFPIFNEHDEVIGFSGRTLSSDKNISKYVNSPSTIVFNKSNVLYNIQNAKKEAKQVGYCYIVEGFMDVFALYKAGIKSSVAIMGTAFTQDHAKILKSLKCELRLCLDGDEAGQHAIVSMCKILDEFQIPYRIVDYKDDLRDPDEILNQDGKDGLFTLLNRLITKSQFVMMYYSKHNKFDSTEAKKQFIRDLIPMYISLKDDVEKDLLVQEISTRINVSSSTILNYIRSLPEYQKSTNDNSFVQTKRTYKSPLYNGAKKSKFVRLQRQLLFYYLENIDFYSYIKNQPFVVFIDDIYAMLATYAEEMVSSNLPLSVNGLINQIALSSGDQKLIDELIDITETKDFVKPGDKEIIDECLNAVSKLLSDKQFKELIDSESFENSPYEIAQMIDKRKKGG